MSASELVALMCCDLGAIVRGRSLPSSARIWMGWMRNCRASATIGPGIVAEKSIVWRAAGTIASSFSISGRKPRSSISSASSSTRIRADTSSR